MALPPVRLPLHLKQTDRSPEADRRRYDLHTAMRRLNPQGFRVVGTKRGITKPVIVNRLTAIASNAYNL